MDLAEYSVIGGAMMPSRCDVAVDMRRSEAKGCLGSAGMMIGMKDKIAVSLDADVVLALRAAVARGDADSVSALVEDAVRARLDRPTLADLAREWEADPEVQRDSIEEARIAAVFDRWAEEDADALQAGALQSRPSGGLV